MSDWVPIVAQFKPEEFDRLERLAARRKTTVNDVLRLFARTCVPDEPSHWKRPQPVETKEAG